MRKSGAEIVKTMPRFTERLLTLLDVGVPKSDIAAKLGISIDRVDEITAAAHEFSAWGMTREVS